MYTILNNNILKESQVEIFGFLPDNKEVFQYTLHNKNGVEISIISFGAAINSLKIPVSKDKKVDVVLGFGDLSDYKKSYEIDNAPYLGAVVGRFAGRIKNAEFSIDSKKYKLDQNNGQNHLHGGKFHLSNVLWVVKELDLQNSSITLEYVSKANQFYPGDLNVQVTYTLTENNQLKIVFKATTTEDTLVNLTQHSYFNLDGHASNLDSQNLFVNANEILEIDKENIPTGNFVNLKNHRFDFSLPKKCPENIDNTFVLKNNVEVAASLISEKNKLMMNVFTSQPAVHIYVGGSCGDQLKSKENHFYHKNSGICFETQNFPDAPNHSNFPNAILRKNEIYEHSTIFEFINL